MDLVEARRLWEVHQRLQKKRKRLCERGPSWRDVMMLQWAVVVVRACSSLCWQVCRTASEKIVAIAVLESEVSDAMWHVPQWYTEWIRSIEHGEHGKVCWGIRLGINAKKCPYEGVIVPMAYMEQKHMVREVLRKDKWMFLRWSVWEVLLACHK